MGAERKRVEPKPVLKVEPKVRELDEAEKEDTNPEPKKRAKPSDDKYIRFSVDLKDNFKAIGDRIQKGELKWAYYAIDGDKGYHYYMVLK